jgi:hypothetical protein
MEEYLRDRISARKVRLYGCATLWKWDMISDKRSLKALEVAEQYADGLASEEELAAAREAAWAAAEEATSSAASGGRQDSTSLGQVQCRPAVGIGQLAAGRPR